MNIRVHSSGRFNLLNNSTAMPDFQFNTKLFWQIGECRHFFKNAGGSCHCYFDVGYLIRIKPGNLYVMPAMQRYNIVADENFIPNLYFMNLTMHPEPCPSITELAIYRSGRCQTLLRSIADLVDEPREIVAPVVQALFTCPEVSTLLNFGKNASILRVLDYINHHYGEQLNNSNLAALANYSQNYFIKAFQQEVGDSPYAYLQNVRLDNAMRMLQNGIPPKEVAISCGFPNQNMFYRSFKKRFQNAPSHYFRSK